MIVRTTHRAYIGADTAMTDWVRDESGRTALNGAQVEVRIGRDPSHPLVTLAGSGDAQGKATWTVTAEAAERLGPGAFGAQVLAGNAVVALAIVEVVG